MFLLGYRGVGKRTVGRCWPIFSTASWWTTRYSASLLLALFQGMEFPITMEIWERVGLVREVVVGAIEDLAPKSNSYVFTNVPPLGLAMRRGGLTTTLGAAPTP